MLQRFAAFLALFCLLAGCQANSVHTPPPDMAVVPIPASETTTPGATASPVTTSTNMPAATPSPTTSDLRQFVVRVQKASLWDAPENENRYWNLQTELLLGERVLVLEHQGEWSRIVAVEQPSSKDPHGYPGWLRSEFLAPGWPAAQTYAVVMMPSSTLLTAPEGTTVMKVYLDTRLPVESTQEGWVQVRLPDNGTGWLRSSDVRLTDDLSAPIPTDSLFPLAESFTGVPYLWGGTTPAALDCSGFIYRLFHAHGILLMRDASDQAQHGEPVSRDGLRKGDLIFTSETSGGVISHVVMYWGNGSILDSSGGRGVALRPLAELLASNHWVTARRYLP